MVTGIRDPCRSCRSARSAVWRTPHKAEACHLLSHHAQGDMLARLVYRSYRAAAYSMGRDLVSFGYAVIWILGDYD
jgi:hypothetical protein